MKIDSAKQINHDEKIMKVNMISWCLIHLISIKKIILEDYYYSTRKNGTVNGY